MWINPKYSDRIKPPAPPEEKGRPLASFQRGPAVELRVTLSEYMEKPYINIRVWERDGDGAWWPAKGKGCSVRMAEVGGMVAALRAAETLSSEPFSDDQAGPARGYGGGSEGETSYVPRGRPVREAFDPAKLKGGEPSAGFDETA